MSGLSRTEEGCRKMLSRLSYSDLKALCDTVTNRRITVGSTRDAMDAIFSYSQSAEELLKRKKVCREIIFKYLSSEGIAMPPDAEKNQLVRRTLQFWALNTMASNVSTTSIHPSSPAYPRSGRGGSSSSRGPQTSFFQATLTSSDWGIPSRSQASVEITTARAKNDVPSSGEEISACDYLALGKQFCQWFYNLVNTQNPTVGQAPQDWGPQHFWEDAWLMLCVNAKVQLTDRRFEGAELVSQCFLSLVRDERLIFCPNLESHGLKCEANPHGLVMVAVAGTIHREQACLGIFEQVFGIIRSPLDANSWKIKFTHLKIRGQN